MSADLKTVYDAASHLSAPERRELVDWLLADLDEPDTSEPMELSDAWREEIRRRVADFRAGRGRTASWPEVKASLRGE